MQHSFVIGYQEQHAIEIRYNMWIGKFKVYVDGICAIDRLLMVDFSFSRDFDLWVGIHERHHIRINKSRPVFFAGFRPHTYTIWVDGVFANRFKA